MVSNASDTDMYGPSNPARPLTEEQKKVAQPLLDTFEDTTLVSGHYKGEACAFVCTVQKEEGGVVLAPIFMVLTEGMRKDCRGPDGEVPALPDP